MSQKLEIITEDPERSFVYKMISYPDPTCVWHYHTHYELHLIHHAVGKAVIGNFIGDFDHGHLALTGPNLPHNWHSEMTSDDASMSPQVDYVIQFTHEFLEKSIAKLPEASHIRALLANSSLGLEFFGHGRELADTVITRMQHENNFCRLLSLFEILNILGQSNERRVLASQNYLFKKDMEIADHVEMIALYVKNNFRSDLTQAQTAKKFNMTQETFCRFFRKHFGRNFNKYLNAVRVGEACSLLMETDISVSEIAFSVGYNNISNFNRRFLELKNTTPRHFRLMSRSKDGFFGQTQPEVTQYRAHQTVNL